MTYIISNLDESKFITLDSYGKFTWTTSKQRANQYQFDKAQNVINNCLVKPTTNYKMLEYLGDPMKENVETAVDAINKFSATRIKECDWDSELSFDVVTTAIQYKDMVRELQNEKIKLNNCLVVLSRAMIDLYHYKEINSKLSAVNICRLYKFECNVLHKRRECKEKLFFVDKLLEELAGDDVEKELDGFISSPHTYRVRVLDGLFDTGVIGDFDEWWEEIKKGQGYEDKRTCATIE